MSIFNTRTALFPSTTLYPSTSLFPSGGLITRHVYLDYTGLGSTWSEITDLVKYQSLSISQRAFSDDFHYAINQASFTCNYDYDLYGNLTTLTNDILVQITLETDFVTEILFQGRIAPNVSRTYDGMIDNMVLNLEATDSTRILDKEIGDVCYRNYKVMDPSAPTASIVHVLALQAGLTAAQIGNVSILTALSGFSPASETDSILDVLDRLLYEYGYTLSFSADDKLTPIPWVTLAASSWTFNESNILGSATVEDLEIEYEGAEVTYYELGDMLNKRVYYESLPIDEFNVMTGYSIPANTLYPAEANAIDTTTSGYQVVYQEYTTETLEYYSNPVVTAGEGGKYAGYNYEAFKSDFSAIVATSGHVLRIIAENSDEDGTGGAIQIVPCPAYDVVVDGATVLTYHLGNKKARVILRNTDQSYARLLYAFGIYADVLYRKNEHKKTHAWVLNSKKVNKYTSQFVYVEATAKALVEAMSHSYEVGNTVYKIKSEEFVAEGGVVAIVMGDGTNQECLVMQRDLDESTGIYSYTLRGHEANTGEITKSVVKYSSMQRTNSSISASLSSYSLVIPTDSDKLNPDVTAAFFSVSVVRGGLDETATWTLTPTAVGCTGAFGSGVYFNKYSVTGITDPAGYVDIVCSKTGYNSLTLHCVVAMAPEGVHGSPGATGTSVAWKGDLAAAPDDPEAGWAYHNTTTHKAYVYQSEAPAGWYVMTEDGVNGLDGTDSYSTYLTNSSKTLLADQFGVVSSFTAIDTRMMVYLGDVDVTDSQTYSAVASAGISGSFDVGAATNKYMVSAFSSAISYGYVTITASGSGHSNFSLDFWLTKVTVGTDSRSISVTADYPVIQYDDAGLTPDPATVTVSGTAHNTAAGKSVYYQFLVNGSSVQNTTANTYPVASPASIDDTPVDILCYIRETSASGTVLARDQYSILGIQSISNGITVSLSNEAHSLSTTELGVVTYSGSGTAINVWEGGEALKVDQNSTYGAGTFRVSASGTGVTVGTPSGDDGDTVRTYGDHSSMTTDAASVLYTVTVTDLAGSEKVILKKQGLTKTWAGTKSRTVNLTAAAQFFRYNPEGITPSPATAVISGTVLNSLGTVWYDFMKNGSSVQNSVADSYTYTPPASYSDTADVMELDIREGAGTGDILGRDLMSMVGVKSVVNGVTVHLSNASCSLSIDDGVVDYAGSGTTVEVWIGATQLPVDTSSPYAKPSFRVSASGTNITAGAVTTSGTYYAVVADHSAMLASAASVELTITVVSDSGVEVTWVKKQSITKSLQGINAEIMWMISSSQVLRLDKSGVLDPDHVTISGMKQTDGTLSDYDARFRIYHDDSLVYESAGDEHTHTHSPVLYPGAAVFPRTTLYPFLPSRITIEMFEAGGFTVQLDMTTVLLVKEGVDGYGNDARTVSLTAYSMGFTYDTAGLIPDPASAFVTATSYNTSATVYYQFYLNDVLVHGVTSGLTAQYTYVPRASFGDMPDVIKVKIRETSILNAVVAEDTFTMVGLKAGSDAVVINFSNHSQNVPASNAGVVSSHVGTGGSFKAWDGVEPLLFSLTSTAGTFVIGTPVVAPTGKITVGAFSGAGTATAVMADHSDMASDVDKVSITFAVTVKKYDGTVEVHTVIQNIGKNKVGVDGDSLYTWRAYSNSADGATDFNHVWNNHRYDGVAYNKVSDVESDIYTDYEWRRFQGLMGYTLITTGGVRSISWDALGENPSPATSTPFVIGLYQDNAEVTAGVMYAWTTQGQLTGSGNSSSFTPVVDDPHLSDLVPTKVSATVSYAGNDFTSETDVLVYKTPAGVDWVADWDGRKAVMNGRYILGGGMYLGSVTTVSGVVGLDRGVLITTSGVVHGVDPDFNGIIGVKTGGIVTFKLDAGTGDASFGGELVAASGSFSGSLTASTVSGSDIYGNTVRGGVRYDDDGIDSGEGDGYYFDSTGVAKFGNLILNGVGSFGSVVAEQTTVSGIPHKWSYGDSPTFNDWIWDELAYTKDLGPLGVAGTLKIGSSYYRLVMIKAVDASSAVIYYVDSTGVLSSDVAYGGPSSGDFISVDKVVHTDIHLARTLRVNKWLPIVTINAAGMTFSEFFSAVGERIGVVGESIIVNGFVSYDTTILTISYICLTSSSEITIYGGQPDGSLGTVVVDSTHGSETMNVSMAF